MEKKTARKEPALRVNALELTGQIKFSHLLEPDRRFVDDKNPYGYYSATIVLDKDSAIVKTVEDLRTKAIEAEKNLLPPHQKGRVKESLPNVYTDLDKDKNPTGKAALQLRRKENMGRPGIYDHAGTAMDFTRDFIRSGSDVKVQVTATSYNVGGTLGIALKLENIQIIHETEGEYTAKPMAASFKPVNLDDTPLA